MLRNYHRVRCIETQQVFESAAAAAKSVQRSRAMMSMHLNGRVPAVAGYHFEVIGEEEYRKALRGECNET